MRTELDSTITIKDWEYNSRWDADDNCLIEWYENIHTGQCIDSACDKHEFNIITNCKQ